MNVSFAVLIVLFFEGVTSESERFQNSNKDHQKKLSTYVSSSKELKKLSTYVSGGWEGKELPGLWKLTANYVEQYQVNFLNDTAFTVSCGPGPCTSWKTAIIISLDRPLMVVSTFILILAL